MATVYNVLDSRDKNELNQTITNTKKELQGNIDTLETKHDNEVAELQEQVDALEKNKATKAELSSHNTSNSAHNDIRLLIQNLTTRLNTLADSDDDTLDQMSEIVAYIEANRDLIESITTSKVSVSDIINNLTTNVSNKPLSAAMGVTLKALIDAIPDNTNTIVDEKIAEHNVDADAHEDIRTDVLNAQSTASGAKTAADNAQAAADAAQADVDDALDRLNSLELSSGKLDREVSTTDGIVTCEDALPDSGLIETKFYGKTVQNLWVNPNGSDNGITETSNSDGSVTVNGTTVDNEGFWIRASGLYTLKPNTKYVLIADKSVSNFYYAVYFYQSGSAIGHFSITPGNRSIIFTSPSAFDFSACAIFSGGEICGSGVTISGTYRVMLREATEAEIAAAASTPQTLPVYPDDSGTDASNDELGIMPLNDVSTLSDTYDDYWCPPGLSSIDNVEIVTAGKNLVDDSTFIHSKRVAVTSNGVEYSQPGSKLGPYIPIASGVSVKYSHGSFEPKAGVSESYAQLWWYDAARIGIVRGFSVVNSFSGYTQTCEAPAGAAYFRVSCPDIDDIELMVCYSDEESTYSYEPPQVTTTPIDLQSYSLCSLPDGTRDELRIDKGSVTLIKRVWEYKFTGEESWGGPYDTPYRHFATPNVLSEGSEAVKQYIYFNNKLIAGSSFINSMYIANVTYRSIYLREPTFANTANDIKSWIKNNKPTILYKLNKPKTIQLGTITPPRLPASTSHVWINGTANTTNFALPINDLSVRYWLPNGELVADIYDNGATEELLDNEIISIWNGATGDIVEASNTDIEAIFDDE